MSKTSNSKIISDEDVDIQIDPSMYRPDGSLKSSKGFLGPIKSKDGQIMTEFSIGIQINGKEIDVPSLVPGLTKSEIDLIKSGNINESIQIKARNHALKRINEGKSVFYVDEEQELSPITPSGIRKENVNKEKQTKKVYSLYADDLISPDERQSNANTKERMKSLYGFAGYDLEYENEPLVSSTDPFKDYVDAVRAQKKLKSEGLKKEIAYALTLDTADEIQAVIRAVNNESSFDEEFKKITEERDKFREQYPGVSTGVAIAGSLLPAGAGVKALGSVSKLSAPARVGIVEAGYGAAAGSTPEERALLAGIGGTAGYALSRGAQALIKDPTKGTLREVDPIKVGDDVDYIRSDGSTVIARVVDDADDSFTLTLQPSKDSPAPQKQFKVKKESPEIQSRVPVDIDDINLTPIERVPAGEEAPYSPISSGQYQPVRFQRDIIDGEEVVSRRVVGKPVTEQEPITPKFREAPRTKFEETVYGPPKKVKFRDAENVGQLYDAFKSSVVRGYLYLKPMTDLLQGNVSRQVGARAQRADETATRISQIEYEQFVEPIKNLAMRFDTDTAFKHDTLRYSEGSIKKDTFVNRVREAYGNEEAAKLNRYLMWSERKNKEFNLKVGKKPGLTGENYLHRQKIFASQKEANEAIEKEFSELLALDAGYYKRTADLDKAIRLGKKDIIDSYQNPFFTNSRRIFNNEKLYQYAEKFSVSGINQGGTPEQILAQIRQSMVKRGISPDRADYAIEQIRKNLLGERKLMNQYLQALQTLGYAGSLAGPKSALLNLHDIPQTAVTQGPAAIRSWFKGIVRDKEGKFLSDSFGFSQQSKFGEFANALNQSITTKTGLAKSLNNTSNEATNALMKVSLFQLSDKVGKGGVLRSVQQRAVDDVAKGGWRELKKQWGSYFSDSELVRIARELGKHGMNDAKYSKDSLPVIEEMMMAGLGQQQLISAGGRPALWADHPNARIFLALRGFAMKQQALAYRNIVQNIQEGNTEAAKEYAIRYALYSMGAFSVINEGRQFVFGDGDPSGKRMVRSFFDQLLGVISLNSASISDYSWGKFQRGEFLSYLAANNVPIAVGVPAEAVDDMFDTLTGEKTLGQLPDTLPLVKQVKNLVRNVEEN